MALGWKGPKRERETASDRMKKRKHALGTRKKRRKRERRSEGKKGTIGGNLHGKKRKGKWRKN